MSIMERIKRQVRLLPYLIKTGYRETAERVNPDFPDVNFESHHKVYELASQFIQGKDVLDCGCGTGYGAAYLLGQGARSVTGIDYSREALAFATKRYRDRNLRFLRMDAQQLTFPDGSFDFVFSSENLEHLPDPRANVAEIRRVLRPGGIALISTPNKEVSSPGLEKCPNKYHLKEFYFEELRDLLKDYFADVHLFENTVESAYEIGRQMKQERIARGAVGLSRGSTDQATLGDRVVDLRHLHNTHSFLSLCW